jgi:hypothetical protein
VVVVVAVTTPPTDSPVVLAAVLGLMVLPVQPFLRPKVTLEEPVERVVFLGLEEEVVLAVLAKTGPVLRLETEVLVRYRTFLELQSLTLAEDLGQTTPQL